MSTPELAVDDLQWREQWARGSRTWLVREPWSLQHFQLTELQRYIWTHYEAGCSVPQIVQRLRTEFPEHEVRSQEIAAFISDLQASGLSASAQWGVGQARFRANVRRRASQYHSWWSPWTIRCPLFDPTPWLAPLGGLARVCFHPLLATCVMLASILAFMHALGSMDRGVIDWSHWRQPGIWLGAAICLAITKSCHEIGHALACRRFGVECHEIGLLWLFCLPCLYCDVSDSWRLSNRWQRITIALAGIYVEWMLAILAYVAWSYAAPGTFKSVMLLTALSASLGTLMINANPLLRYDGYFVLSDLIGWPNLWQDAGQACRTAGGWCWGIAQRTSYQAWPFVLLLVFALLSICYRLLLTGSLMLVLLKIFPVREMPAVALTLAAGLLMPWVAAMIASVRSISSGNKQAWVVHWGKRLVMLGLLFMTYYAFTSLPFETKIASRAMCRIDIAPVYAPASGIVTSIKADGTLVKSFEPLVTLRDWHKERLLQKLQLEMDVLQANYDRMKEQEVSDAAIAQTLPAMQAVLVGKQEQLRLVTTELNRLKVMAGSRGGSNTDGPAAELGTWSYQPTMPTRPTPAGKLQSTATEVRSNREDYTIGASIDKGSLLGCVETNQPPIIEAYVPESELDRIDVSRIASLRMDYWPDRELQAEIVEVLPEIYAHDQRHWPSQDPMLPVVQRGGRIELAVPHFVVRLRLLSGERLLLQENWATVQFPTRSQTCSWHCWRWMRATFAY